MAGASKSLTAAELARVRSAVGAYADRLESIEALARAAVKAAAPLKAARDRAAEVLETVSARLSGAHGFFDSSSPDLAQLNDLDALPDHAEAILGAAEELISAARTDARDLREALGKLGNKAHGERAAAEERRQLGKR